MSPDTRSFALATLLEAKVQPLIIRIQFQGIFVTLGYVQNWKDLMRWFAFTNGSTLNFVAGLEDTALKKLSVSPH